MFEILTFSKGNATNSCGPFRSNCCAFPVGSLANNCTVISLLFVIELLDSFIFCFPDVLTAFSFSFLLYLEQISSV